MPEENIKGRLKDNISPVVVFVVVLLIWEIGVSITDYPEYLLPKPSRIIDQLITNFNSLISHTGITMMEAVLGYVIANILAFLTAVSFAHLKIIEKAFYPFAIALETTPIIAMAPLLVLWFGTDVGSKIVAAAVVSFFPMLVNTIKGLKALDEEALDLFKSMFANKWQIFIKLKLPNALPYIFSALKTSAALSVIGAIVGEFVGANKGIGYVILISTYHLETVKMFTAIIMSSMACMLFFQFVSLIEKKVVFWEKS